MKRRPSQLILLFCCALAFGLYCWVFDYIIVLQYESAESFFLFGAEFFGQWLDRPGGMLLYTGRFLRQFYHYEWLGALVAAVSITASVAAFALVLARLGRGVFHLSLTAAALLVLHIQGTDLTPGLFVVSVVFLGYLALGPGRAGRGYALLATPLLYWVAGGYFWFFAFWVLAAAPKGRAPGPVFRLAYAAAVACIPFIAYRWVFPMSLSVALRHPLYPEGSALALAFCAYLLLMPLWARLPIPALARAKAAGILQAALLAVAVILLLASSFDPTMRHFAGYHRLYKDGRWEALLQRAAADEAPSRMSQFLANYALYRKGRLLDELFSYPQIWGTHGLVLSFSEDPENLRSAMYNSDLLFEMGHTNAAFRMAYNQMNQGKTYANLRRVAECGIVNGNYANADKYLNILERSLFHRDFALRQKRLIAAAQSDAGLAAKRALRPTMELDLKLGEFAALLCLVESNPANRMAFDYLIAWCMLDKTLIPRLAQNLDGFAEAGYDALPVHCQEALLTWRRNAGTGTADGAPEVDPQVEARFRRFGKEVQQYPSRAEARRGLRGEFGGSYMYYYAVATPPAAGGPDEWVRLGTEFHAMGDLAEAETCCRHALEKDPASAEAHLCLGSALLAQNRPAEAAAHLSRVMQVLPRPGKGGAVPAPRLKSH